MTSLTARLQTGIRVVSTFLFLACASAACGDDDGGGGTPDGGGGTPDGGGGTPDGGGGTPDGGGSACVSGGGTGTLSIKIAGVAPGRGMVAVVETSQGVASTTDLALAAGPYTVTADRTTSLTGDEIVRTAYEPSIDSNKPCVRVGQTTTVTVTYTVIASSGRVWAGNTSAGKELLGFGQSTVAASGSPPADIAAGTNGSGGFAFDAAGNVWVIGATLADPPLARFAASVFAASGSKTPDLTIQSPSFGGGIPGPRAIAFDHAGNMWVSVVAANKVVRFTPAQLAAGGAATAAVEISAINGPAGIAFDASGNMFVASSGDATVVRIDAARLAVSGSGGTRSITVDRPGPVSGPLPNPIGLAFDAASNLWVNFDGTLARLTPTDLVGTGSATITPDVLIATDVLALPEGIAFDDRGGLWLAYSAGKLARLGSAQLAASASVTPEIVISSPDIAYAGWFGIYPAAAGTPLYHHIP